MWRDLLLNNWTFAALCIGGYLVILGAVLCGVRGLNRKGEKSHD